MSSRFNSQLLQVVDISSPGAVEELFDNSDEQLREATKNSPCKLRVGDQVRLNDVGLEQCFGNAIGLSHMKTKVYTITHVDALSITAPEASYPVEVSDPELNALLLADYCFDLVTPLPQGRTVAVATCCKGN